MGVRFLDDSGEITNVIFFQGFHDIRGEVSKKIMLDQNSAIDHQIRPDQLQAELDIKKDAYYAYLRHLDIKAQRGPDGKLYLEPE